MRRPLLTAVVAPLLVTVLAACGGDDDATTTPEPTAGQTGAPAPEGTDTAADTAGRTAADGEGGTAAPVEGDSAADGVEGGEEGQAAADVAAEFLVALAQARPEACDSLLSFTSAERPMTEVAADHELCVELLPEVISAQAEAQGLSEDMAASLEGLVITGAEVDGDTAVVDGDNYPPELAGSMGDLEVRLKKLDERWYVDLEDSFAVPTSS